METRIRFDHHPPDAAPRRLSKLGLRRHGRRQGWLLHHGRKNVRGGGRSVCQTARARLDLSRQALGELGPGARHSGVRFGSGESGRRRQTVGDSLPVRQWTDWRHDRLDGGHHASGNHVGRRCGGGASGRRTLYAFDRQATQIATVEPSDPDHCRRLCRQSVRHRLREDHPGARLQRFPNRSAPQTRHHQRVDA